MIARTARPPGFMFLVGLLLAPAALPGCGGSEKTTAEPSGEHGAGHSAAMLMVRTEPAEVTVGSPIRLNLMVHGADRVVIKDFETVHEKKLHLIIASDGLDQFAHIHPEIDASGNISATFAFPTAGKYRLYADYKASGKEAETAIGEVLVAGTPVPAPKLVPNVPGRVKGDDLEADIVIESGSMAGATKISFALFDASGKPITDLQPYLGAMGHLVVISADGMEYVHSHPMEGHASDGAVGFEAHFPQPGIYKAWGQFQRSGTVHVVPFVVSIE